MNVTEIKTGGLGGQGVILAGMIIGRAASIYADLHATLTQSFGPEARGSACGASIVVSDEPIEYPYVTNPNILVVMSQEACNQFGPDIAPGGTLLYESDFVEPRNVPEGIKTFGIPATRLAEKLQRRMVANIVMVGFFASTTDLIDAEAVRKSVEASVPQGTESLNLEAFELGYKHGQSLKEGNSSPVGAAQRK